MFDYINAYCRVDKFWNSEIDYKSSQARADHELVVRAIDGTVASGEAFAKKASKTISQTNGGQEEIIKKMAVISGTCQTMILRISGGKRELVIVHSNYSSH